MILKQSTVTSSYEALLQELKTAFPQDVHFNVSLAEISRWKIGGIAKCIVRPDSVEKLQQILCFVNQHNLPYIVLGSTTNLLFSDAGLHVVAVQITSLMGKVSCSDNEVFAEAGIWVPQFARKLAGYGLTGAEHICGIPGTLGGLIYMNGGSQRRGIGENIAEVTTIAADGNIRHYSQEECEFGYRRSAFQTKNEIIISAKFRFVQKQPKLIKQEMLGILKSRRQKFPQKYPNCGSVFVSNPAMYQEFGPPGLVIEQCGLKGAAKGHAIISPQHANFIVNTGNATAKDTLFLINLARHSVINMTGYDMQAEAIFIDTDGSSFPAHIVAEQIWGKGCQ